MQWSVSLKSDFERKWFTKILWHAMTCTITKIRFALDNGSVKY